MIAEVIRSVAVSSYQVKDVRTLKVKTVSGSPTWRPGDRVVVVDSFIVGAAAVNAVAEIVRV